VARQPWPKAWPPLTGKTPDHCWCRS